MKKNFHDKIVGAWIILCLSGCISTQNQVTENDLIERNIAQTHSTSLNSPLREEFLKILYAPNAGEAIVARLDKYFTLRLKANISLEQFSKELNQKWAYKKKNPMEEIPDNTESVFYKNLLKQWNLNERYEDEIKYSYAHALRLKSNDSASEEEKKKATALVRGLDNYAKLSQNLKRVEFQPLLAELKEIYRHQAVLNQKKLKEQNGSLQDIAAISFTPEYTHLIFDQPSDLAKYAKTIENKEHSSELLKNPNIKKSISAVNEDLNEIPDPIFERAPQNVYQDLNCENGKKICVDPGPSGNMVGGNFPQGVWAFTYDDGPTIYTSEIMDHFINYKDSQNSVGKTTFFWKALFFDKKASGKMTITQSQDMIKKAIKHNFAIENHSYDHQDLHRPTTDRKKQIIESNEILEAAIRKEDPSYKVQYYRCPYGSCFAPKIPEVRQMIADQKQIHVYWRIDSMDWKLQNSEKSADLVIKQMQLKDHGIILMHDKEPTTPETTRLVLQWLKNQNNHHGKNYKMVTIPEAVELVNGH